MRRFAMAVAALAALGCSSDPADTETQGSGGSSSSSTTAGAGGMHAGGSGGTAQGGGPECPAPEPPHLGEMAAMEAAQAMVIDQTGAPAEGVRVTICGTNLCSGYADSDAQGLAAVSGEGNEFHDPRFNTGYNGRGFAKMSAIVPQKPSYDFGTVRVLRLPSFAEGAMLVPGEEASQGGVTLGLAPETEITWNIDFPDEADRRLVATVFDIRAIDAAELPAVDPSLGLEVLVGMGTLHTKFCPAASLRFDNVAQWAPGTAVELFVHGTDTFWHWAPYGQWAKVAEAVVSDDGLTVATVEGQGIPLLTTYGARPK